MRFVTKLFLLGAVWTSVAGAQDPSKPVLRPGVSVSLPVAGNAVEMRAADELDATVVAITATGKLFLGTNPTEPTALSSLSAGTVYVKADSRTPFQTVLTVLDALRGKSVVLLTAPPTNAIRNGIVPPYGIRLNVSQ
jgi:hypothetical protein